MGGVQRLPVRPAAFRAARRGDGDDAGLQSGAPQGYDDASKIVQEIEDLSLPEGASRALLPAPIFREDSPDFQGWKENVERALEVFTEGRLGKVVLARRAEFVFCRD